MPHNKINCNLTDIVLYVMATFGMFLSDLIAFFDHHIGFISFVMMSVTFIASQYWKRKAFMEIKSWDGKTERRKARKDMLDD